MSTANLQRLLAGIEAGTVPADVTRWLRTGLRNYLDAKGGLEECLFLKARRGRSSEHPPTQIKLEVRDEIVRRLARQIPGSLWKQAGHVAECVRSYQVHPDKPPNVCGWRLKYLAEANRLQLSLPTSQSQIHRILQGRRD